MRTILLTYGLFSCFLLFAQLTLADNRPTDLETVLSLAGANRSELESVITHYSHSKNKEKQRAARFLIENMRWHASNVFSKKQHNNMLLDSLTRQADSLYYHCVTTTPADSLEPRLIEVRLTKVRQPFWNSYNKLIAADKLYRPMKAEYDYKTLTASELIRHIDHAFHLREQVEAVKKLSFDDFCEYILPYRSISDYPLMDMPEAYLNLLGKYFTNIPSDSIIQKIQNYNATLYRLKRFFPKYPYATNIGYQELFFNGFHDCIAIAQYGTSTLRMLGIPAAVEFNIAYKQFQGVHYMCSLLMPDGKWTDFNPESALPTPRQNDDFRTNGSMNVYRFMFAAQKDTPFFLHAKDEYVPEELNCPFMRDVSSRLLSTTSLSLPFREACNNELAYLATFSSVWEDGLVPVTWAKIDKAKNEAVFAHVVTERIYFPVYYSPTGESIAFSEPFYVNRLGQIVSIGASKGQAPIPYNITRKFPWKPNLKERSRKLIGTVVLASRQASMNPCDTIATITHLLNPYYQDIVLDTCGGPYSHYRIQTTKQSPHADIAEIQFLTSEKFGYSNVCAPSPLPILAPEDMNRSSDNEVRLLEDSLSKIKWKAEYDGNPQTAPTPYPTINFNLKEPQYVTRIRLMPIHADNGIIPGDVYTLLHWKGSRWEDLGRQTAKYNYLSYNIVKGDLYWLQNLTKGKEELPFIVDEKGEQQFIYYDMMND